MNRVRLSDKLLAIVMLATSLLCFARLYLALGGDDFASGGMSQPLGEPVSFARLAVFLAAGVICAFAALWFWSGRADRSRQEPARGAPLFGRNVATRPDASPRLRQFLVVAPFVAILRSRRRSFRALAGAVARQCRRGRPDQQ